MNDELKYTWRNMSFTWDDAKAIANFRKHNVTFELAAEVFSDEYAVNFYDDMHDEYEPRFQIIGTTEGDVRILFVVYAERVYNDDVELLRIISARDANEKEMKIYGMGLPEGISEDERRSYKARHVGKRRRH
ncbi:MAG: BrnT family toxin [Synergistaceae bacterium]|nr:BrnT family toxin [Synergistaceae bacterium]